MIEFIVPITRAGDWNQISFALPPESSSLFSSPDSPKPSLSTASAPSSPVKPTTPTAASSLPAAKPPSPLKLLPTPDGSLFFNSHATTDVRIGSGLLHQVTTLDLRVLQGKLSTLSLALNGPGEILSVVGDSVVAWSVTGEKDARRIEVKLSRPIEGSKRIIIEAQAALAGFPVKMDALRIAPTGTLRHSGFLSSQ